MKNAKKIIYNIKRINYIITNQGLKTHHMNNKIENEMLFIQQIFTSL